MSVSLSLLLIGLFAFSLSCYLSLWSHNERRTLFHSAIFNVFPSINYFEQRVNYRIHNLHWMSERVLLFVFFFVFCWMKAFKHSIIILIFYRFTHMLSSFSVVILSVQWPSYVAPGIAEFPTIHIPNAPKICP